jgi:hypothetical protein
LHSSHWKANEEGLPVHVPVVAVSVSPSPASPLIVGRVLFDGAGGVDGGDADIVAVGEDSAVPEPARLLAVTVTRTRRPTSDSVSVRLAAVAPAIGWQ